MNNSFYPCLTIKGRIAEAADFYIAAFGDGKKGQSNSYVIQIELSGQKFMLLNEEPESKPGPAISFMVISETAAETEGYWNTLIEGGKALMQLDTYPWSERYGWLQDKFGISWQLQTAGNTNIMQKFSPLLMFTGEKAGKAKEAMDFYTGIFPDSRVYQVFNYQEGEGDRTDYIKHAQFCINDYMLMAMESSGPHDINFNDAVSIVAECEDQAEVDRYWDALSTGGGREVACGWLTDKYGVSWQIVPKGLMKLLKDPERAQRVMAKLMKMKKLILADLESA